MIHRDLKPENILCLYNRNNDPLPVEIRVTDFGFCKKYDESNPENLYLNTPFYTAPEVLNHQRFDHKADVWSLGVLTYLLVTGYPCFVDPDAPNPSKDEVFAAIRNTEPNMDRETLGRVSPELKSFITSCLHKDPAQRASVADLLQHEWITEYAWVRLDDHAKKTTIGGHLQKFLKFSKFQSGVCSLISNML